MLDSYPDVENDPGIITCRKTTGLSGAESRCIRDK